MNQRIIFIGLVIFSLFFKNSVRAQDVLTSLEEVKGFQRDKIKEMIPIQGENGAILLVLIGKKAASLFLLNSTFSLQQKWEDLSCPYYGETDKILGSIHVAKQAYAVFFSNREHTQFIRWSFDLEAKSSRFDSLSIPIENMVYLESFDINNRFNILMMERKSLTDKVWVFSTDKSLILNKEEYLFQYPKDYKGGSRPLFHSLWKSTSLFSKAIDINKISNNSPNTISNTHFARKLYYSQDTIFLTYDNYGTQVWTLDLNNKVCSFKTYFIQDRNINQKSGDSLVMDYPIDPENSKNAGTYNSFIDMSKKRIFIGELLENSFTLQAQKLDTKEILNSYKMVSDSLITWKNSEIIQNKTTKTILGTDNEQRILEKSSQLIRKMNNGEIGIAINKYQSNLELLVGSYQEVKSGGGPGIMLGGFTAGLGAGVADFSSFGYSPMLFNYNSYANSKITYFKSILEVNSLNHLIGVMNPSVFEKVKNFEDNVSLTKSGKILFSYQDFYILGYYDQGKKTYTLLKF